MFLLYTNDIITNINSLLRMFADDCLLYRIIYTPEDTAILQQDLDQIASWVTTWQLTLNITKCVLIRRNRSHSPIHHHYTLNHCILKQTDSHSYLGVMLDKTLSWSLHISNIAKKHQILFLVNFLKRRNLSDCSPNVKASAYLTMVRPQMELNHPNCYLGSIL